MMKRRNRLILITVLAAALLLALLHGCQSSVTPVNAPEKTEAPMTEPTADTSAGAETTEAAATELPEISTEATDNTESTQATEAPTEAPTETTEAATEPETPSNPKPADPKPANPTPTPTEPKTTEPAPTEPTPTDPSPTEPPHTHSWSDWTQTKAPSCTAGGEEIRTCSCGAKESRTVNALGHNWSGWSQTKAPTCGAEGAEARSCSRCGMSESRSVPATGAHSWNETAPTCTQAGSKTCKVCGKTESTAAALEHDWVHHDEEGEYRPVITCYCGMRFIGKPEDISDAESAWLAHFYSFERADRDNHGGYEAHEEWFVTTPAYAECSHCGTTK